MKETYLTLKDIRDETAAILEEVKPIARSYRPELNLHRMALLVVDMQLFFLHERGHGFIPSANAIIPGIRALEESCIQAGVPVFLTRHVNTLQDAGMMKKRWKELLTAGHAYIDIHPDLILPQVRIIRKSQFDAFYNTELEGILRDMGRDQLVITGVMTNLCCETTVRSAFVRNIEPVFPVDTTAAYNREFHISTFRNLLYGFIHPVLSEELLNNILK